jgi:hypothetical protein
LCPNYAVFKIFFEGPFNPDDTQLNVSVNVGENEIHCRSIFPQKCTAGAFREIDILLLEEISKANRIDVHLSPFYDAETVHSF